MKTIGLLGGMSWESTAEYYRIINETVKEKLGGLHSAKIVLRSIDFAEMEEVQLQGNWGLAARMMSDWARSVETAGAECLIICTNTMHKVADQIASAINIPILHIADATAQAVKDAGLETVGLLGTRYTMEQEFYRGRLESRHGLNVIVPNDDDRKVVHDVIYQDLCSGVIRDEARIQYQAIVDRLGKQGAQAIILGCTEIGLLLKQKDTKIPLFDTTVIHAQSAAFWSLQV